MQSRTQRNQPKSVAVVMAVSQQVNKLLIFALPAMMSISISQSKRKKPMRITNKKTASDSRQQDTTNTCGIALIERGYWQQIISLTKMMRTPLTTLKKH